MKRMRAWLVSVPVLAFLACGGGGNASEFSQGNSSPNGTTGASNTGTGTGTGTGSTGTGTGSTGTGTGSTNNGGASGTAGGGPAITHVDAPLPDQVCAKDQSIAEVNPLDIYIVQDRSLSMDYTTATGETKWQVVTAALQAFLSDPGSAGLQVGIGFFAQFTDPADPSVLPDLSCDLERYSTPTVPIGPIASTASSILAAFGQIHPQGETPTRVAELGAVAYAKTFAAANPTHRVVIILATDGDPNVCESSVVSVANAATSGSQHNIKTYVIGVLDNNDHRGDQVKNMNLIASHGNTGAAFIVDSATGTGAQFTAAMKAIRNSNKMVCQFDIPRAPSGEVLDMSKVDVQYNGVSLPYIADPQTCGEGPGWYYDDPRKPGVMRLCKNTCSQVQTDPTAKVEFVFGCQPVPPPQPHPETTGGTTTTVETGGTVEQGGTPVTDIPQAGNGGEPNAPAECLLDGQACTDNSVCCSNFCNANNVCGAPVF